MGQKPEEQQDRCLTPISTNTEQGQESQMCVFISVSSGCISPPSIFRNNQCNVKNVLQKTNLSYIKQFLHWY